MRTSHVLRYLARYRGFFFAFCLFLSFYQLILPGRIFSTQYLEDKEPADHILQKQLSFNFIREKQRQPRISSEMSVQLFDRKIIKFNLMEEIYGKRWSKNPHMYFSTNDCTVEYANANQLSQDHPCVIHLIRKTFLREPAPRDSPYHLNKPTLIDPSDGQSQAILRLLRNQTGGFFIECGALDGEFLSNTLYMERSLNWTGILIEADQKAFSQLDARNRKAYTLPICLSTKPFPQQVVFNASDWSGSYIVGEENQEPRFNEKDENKGHQMMRKNAITDESVYKVQCFPLYSILLAVGRTEIDYFGLDVEGSEFKILKTIPWHKVDFKTLSVEWNHVPEGEAALTRLMEGNKFVKFGHIDMAYSREVIYVKDFLHDFRQYEFD